MKTKQVTKLFAVVALATSTAAADPAPVVTPAVAAAKTALVAARALQSLVIELARPRVMPTGAPACGNVASRAPRPASCNPEGSEP